MWRAGCRPRVLWIKVIGAVLDAAIDFWSRSIWVALLRRRVFWLPKKKATESAPKVINAVLCIQCL